MSERLEITAVSYLNTKPLLYGILQSPVARRLQLQLNAPARCARLLEEGAVDLGLVPVAALANLPDPRIVSDFCIGTVGAVKTVGLFSDRPVDRIERIYLDPHSRTSVELLKILLREHWQADPRLVAAPPGYIERISGTDAGLVIGDRSIGLEDRFAYAYDLGQAWMDHTGLPFVFAAWVARRPLDPGFLREFNRAMANGLEQIPQLVYLLPEPRPGFDLAEYFTRHISYALDDAKKNALALFLDKMGKPRAESLLESLA